ncbi:hypothetical protein BB561_006597 [Smittium simulii]|uniref:Exocyst complex component Sec3 C-terminal domain-containing protein n=1 Tax=Smittium simulii TaxID=133385 RepID=A0A2T9Y2Y3_9FUNG|nr:hypothetical protein BB561_006597 [Smittium simulii]
MSDFKDYTDKTKKIAQLLREQLFIGVEVSSFTQNAAKIAGVTPKKERLLNLLEVKELSSDRIGEGIDFILCLTDEIRSIEHKSENSFSLRMTNNHDFRTFNSLQTEAFIQMLVTYCNKYSPRPPKYINSVGTINTAKQMNKAVKTNNNTNNTQPTKIERKIQTQKENISNTISAQKSNNPLIDHKPQIITSQLNSTGKNNVPIITPQSTHNKNSTTLEFINSSSRSIVEDDASITFDQEEVGEFNSNNGDLLLDQTFMLSADELLGSFGWRANVDASELENHLIKELSKLESENVKNMLEADKKVPVVISELDNAIKELELIDGLLINYCNELDSLGNEVRQIQVENENLKIEEVNQQNLLIELENFLTVIQVSEDQAQYLRSESLESEKGINRVIKVAALLQEKISMRLGGGLEGIEAFRDRKNKYEFYTSNFSTRVFDYLKIMFQIKLYIQCMNKVYNKEGNDLLDSCRPFLFKYRNIEINYLFVQPSNIPQQSQFSYGIRRGSQDNDAQGSNNLNSNLDLQPYSAFGQGLDTVIRNIISEQNFLADLFHYAPYAQKTSGKKSITSTKQNNEDLLSLISFYEYANGIWVPLKNWETPRVIWSSENLVKNVKSMLDLLFGNIKIHINSMMDMGTRYDPSQSLGMIAAVEEKIIECKNTDLEFVQKMLGELNVKLTSIFSQMISQQLISIEEKKLSAKKRIGVLPMVRIFPRFVKQLETMTLKKDQSGSFMPLTKKLADESSAKIGQKILDIFNSLVRDTQKAYNQFNDKDLAKEYTNALTIALENISCMKDGLEQENSKPISVTQNNQKSNLAQNKNTSANSAVFKQFIDITQRMVEQLEQSYVTESLKKPFGKIVDFFNGVQDTLARSKQSIEQSSLYNRNSLRKLLNSYNSREIKEIIKTLYKRVEKHFGQDPKLVRIVWSQITQGILKMQQGFNNTMNRAYSETGVNFDYKQTDLLQWFDEFS